jgi:hypothetical protein
LWNLNAASEVENFAERLNFIQFVGFVCAVVR